MYMSHFLYPMTQSKPKKREQKKQKDNVEPKYHKNRIQKKCMCTCIHRATHTRAKEKTSMTYGKKSQVVCSC